VRSLWPSGGTWVREVGKLDPYPRKKDWLWRGGRGAGAVKGARPRPSRPELARTRGIRQLNRNLALRAGSGGRIRNVISAQCSQCQGEGIRRSAGQRRYFPRESYRKLILQPFVDTNTSGQYDVVCTIKGGGTTGQAGAIIHGIARALDCISDDFHTALRKNGFLTRDSRVVERKKYGKRKARKSTQFSKR